MTHVNLVRRTAAPIWSPAILLFLAAPLPAQRGGGTDSTPAPRSLAEVQTRVQAILVKEKAAGAGIALVTRDSVLWAGGLGLADVAAHRPVTAETHFRVGSISKSFVALALLQLVERSALRLDARVKDLAPELAIENRWESTRPVTVANLLEHTAGFDDMHFTEMYNRTDRPDIPLREVLAINPRSRRVRWSPGTRFSYSNPGYGVAGYVIERAAGVPYDRYIQDSLLAPLGMGTSSFRLVPGDTLVLAKGYNDPNGRPVGYTQIYLRPAGNLHSSPRELAQLVRMFLHRGVVDGRRIVSEASITRMERPATTLLARHGVAAGYGLANYSTLEFPVTFHGHDGGIDGFISDYKYSTELGVGWVVLVNSGSSGRALEGIVRAVEGYLLRDQQLPQKPVARVPAADLTRYTGYYRMASPRIELFRLITDLVGGVEVFLRNDTLYQRAFRSKAQALIPASATTFRLAEESEGNRMFFTDDGGRQVYATPSDYYERASLWGYRLLLTGAALATLLLASAVLAALVWVPRRLRGRISAGPATTVRLLPLLAVLTLAGSLALAVSIGMTEYGLRSWKTVGFAGGTVLFAMLALLSLTRVLTARKPAVSRGARVYALLVSLAAVATAIYCGAYGFIGLRTWAY